MLLFSLSLIFSKSVSNQNIICLDMQDVGKDIKAYTELNGRTDSNMIDALNAMFERDMTKVKLI